MSLFSTALNLKDIFGKLFGSIFNYLSLKEVSSNAVNLAGILCMFTFYHLGEICVRDNTSYEVLIYSMLAIVGVERVGKFVDRMSENQTKKREKNE